MSRVRAWLQRLLAVALLGLLLAVVYGLGVRPLVNAYSENEAAIAEARDLLAGFEGIAASAGDLQGKLAEVTAWQAVQTFYLTRETDALAAADLQQRVKTTVNDNGGTLRSIQTLPGQKEGDFQRITLRLQMTATTEALFRIAYELETTDPFLFLDRVDIKARASRDAQAEPALTVTLDLYGYRPPEGGL